MRLRVNAPPDKGKANQAIIRTLATFFHIAPRYVHLVRGHTQRTKVLEIQANREDALGRLQGFADTAHKKSEQQELTSDATSCAPPCLFADLPVGRKAQAGV